MRGNLDEVGLRLGEDSEFYLKKGLRGGDLLFGVNVKPPTKPMCALVLIDLLE